MTSKKIFVLLGTVLLLMGCSSTQEKNKLTAKEELATLEQVKLTYDTNERYQQVKSFGASGAWWSQDVGGWTDKEGKTTKRDKIAELLFDPAKGIGLSSYRYNLGAGSLENGQSQAITDPWRASESFETAPGTYDFTKDKNAQYMLQAAVAHGVEDVYLFANSPLERLTKNGNAYGSDTDEGYSNLSPSNYVAFSDYLLDVAEHFVAEGLPITALSPINEPQWEWLGGQEGSHYTPEEVVDFAKVIYEEKEKRPSLKDVELSVPELGEWANSSMPYFEAMVADPQFMAYYPNWDIHSYWSTEFQKQDVVDWLAEQDLSPELSMSEWTEMVNGKDVTMDSALNLANVIYEDLTILNVITWQYWIAVSAYDYRDGLIYVDLDTREIEPAKRLWTMGNFSKYIRPGATRIALDSDDKEINAVGFQNAASDEVVFVLINNGLADKQVTSLDGFDIQEIVVTSETQDLEVSKTDREGAFVLPKQSIVTVTGKEK